MSKASFHAALDDSLVKKYKNTEAGIDTFVSDILALGYTPANTTVAVESTGVYHLLFCSRLTKAGYAVLIINPLESHRFMAAKTLRNRKTDTIDAANLRAMAKAGIGRLFTETDEILTLKMLVTEREGLVTLRAMMKQRAEARTIRTRALAKPAYDPSATVLAALDREILMLEAQFLSHAPATQYLLRSIPGLGAVSAASLVAHVSDIRRFSSPEKLVAYIGLDPRIHESGTSVKGRGFISKRGNHQLRTVLFNAAFVARQHNPELRRCFEKKIAEGRHYMSALTAVERKLVHLIWAVWTRVTPYQHRES